MLSVQNLYEPTTYAGGLPVFSSVPVALKDVSVYGTYKPGTNCPTSGFFVWNTAAGIYSLTMCRKIVSNAALAAVDVFDGPTLYANQDWPVPCHGASPTISPDLSTTMSLGRISVGKLSLCSNTTSTTLAALNGSLTVAAVSDLRNCGTFGAPDLAQAATTQKDSAINVPVHVGVSAIVGPDYSRDLEPIDFNDSVDYSRAGVINLPIRALTGTINGSVCYAYAPFFDSTTASINAATCSYHDVIPQGISISVEADLTSIDPAEFYSQIIFQVHVGSVNALTGQLIQNRVYNRCVSLPNNVAGPFVAFFRASANSDIIRIAPNEIVTGVSIRLLNASGLPYLASNITPRIILHDAYGSRGMGSYRVFKWEDVGTDQTLNLSGTLMIEGMPSGSIAPFMKINPASGMTVGSENLNGLMRYMFASPEFHLRRAYEGVSPTWLETESKATRALMTHHSASLQAAGMYAGGMADVVKWFGNRISGFISSRNPFIGTLARSILKPLAEVGGEALEDWTGYSDPAEPSRKRIRDDGEKF